MCPQAASWLKLHQISVPYKTLCLQHMCLFEHAIGQDQVPINENEFAEICTRIGLKWDTNLNKTFLLQ